MAENAFVAALLKVAAEHRLKAESARNMMDPYPERTPGTLGATWRTWLREMNDSLEKEASEHEGLAEVYEAFAHRIISEVAGELILRGLEKLTGPAELLPFEFEPPYDYAFRAEQNWMRTWLHFYRGMDLPNNGILFSGF